MNLPGKGTSLAGLLRLSSPASEIRNPKGDPILEWGSLALSLRRSYFRLGTWPTILSTLVGNQDAAANYLFNGYEVT